LPKSYKACLKESSSSESVDGAVDYEKDLAKSTIRDRETVGLDRSCSRLGHHYDRVVKEKEGCDQTLFRKHLARGVMVCNDNIGW
jgi:hypothetical protein